MESRDCSDSLSFDADSLTQSAPRKFDTDAARDWLRRDIDWSSDTRLDEVRMSRLWAGLPGRVWFELQLNLVRNHEPAVFTLQGAYTRNERRRRHHCKPGFGQGALLGLRILSEKLGLWCCSPDRDRKMRIVRELLDPPALRRLLVQTRAASVLGLDRATGDANAEIVAYRASKRCVLRISTQLDGESRSVFMKVFRRARTPIEMETLRSLEADLLTRSDGEVRLPSVIENLPQQRLLIVAAVPTPSRRLSSSPDDLSAAANVLTTLHGATLDVPLAHTVRNEFELACRRVRELQILGLAHDRLLGLLERIVRAGADVDDRYETVIHGAFHSAQVLRSEAQLWLLDLDTLSHGHVEADLAKFAARLLYVRKPEAAKTEAALASARLFFEHYRRRSGKITDRHMRFYLPCAMSRHGAAALADGDSADAVNSYWQLAEAYASGTSSAW